MNAPVLTLKDLSVAVRAPVGRWTAILNDASIDVFAGESVAFIGPSGSGKSTLLKAVLGLLPFTSGELAFEGETVRRPLDATHRRLRSTAEAVFQNPLAALNPYASLRASIAEPLRASGIISSTLQERVYTTATRVGLTPEILDRKPSAVSLGQAQRACIARALAPRPTLLVLDEPLSALDALIAAEVATLLSKVITEVRPTVLFVSHDMRMVRRLATRVIVIERGRIVEDAPVDQLLEAPQSEVARALVESDRRRQDAFAAARQGTGRQQTTEAVV